MTEASGVIGKSGGHQLLLVVCFVLCHLIFEGLNEALVSLPDVPHSITLWSVAMQFICCGLLPAALGRSKPIREPDKLDTGKNSKSWLQVWLPYVSISAMVYLANSLSQYATHYVEFTLKIVAKSSKLLPTMLIAGLLGNSVKYGPVDYFAAFLLCIGTALFSYGGGRGGTLSTKYGIAALALSCVFDGLVPNAQQRIMRSGVSSAVLMARTNLIGAIGGILAVGINGDVATVATFIWQVPNALVLISGIGLSLAGSVLCYTDLIETVGSVFTVGVATLRKTVSLMLSYILFPGKSFNGIRAVALLLVAIGLFLSERQGTRRITKSA